MTLECYRAHSSGNAAPAPGGMAFHWMGSLTKQVSVRPRFEPLFRQTVQLMSTSDEEARLLPLTASFLRQTFR
jgi:hypothetical protein